MNFRRPTPIAICPAAKKDRAPVQRNITLHARRLFSSRAGRAVGDAVDDAKWVATESIYEVAGRTKHTRRRF
jgi:hypothetical protein